jgi:hypothetical protein
MKVTLDIPDDLYRRVKARSAMEGRPIRSVAVELFQNWLEGPKKPGIEPPLSELTQTEIDAAPWLAITRPNIKPGMSHDMDEIRKAIAKGWAAEAADKLGFPDARP